MKKIITCIMAILLIVSSLAGCGSSDNGTTENSTQNTAGNSTTADSTQNTNQNTTDGKSLKIVTTIFAPYDWVRQVLGDQAENAELTMLIDSGVDLHSFQPTADDIVAISTCDMFIYIGGESDSWVEDALKTASNENMIVINLMDILGDQAKVEEIKEGMEEEEHDHDHDEDETHSSEEDTHEEDHDHDEEEELDEHVWLSLRNAQTFCTYIAGQLGELDQENAELYLGNAKAYNSQLSDLDAEYEAAVAEGTYDTLLFGDRFPFRYLVDDYGLDYYAAFAGCSAETEASFSNIVILAGKVDELGLKSVMVIENSDQSIAKTIVDNTSSKDQKILVLDSIQSVTAKEVSSGATYLSLMESNLNVLKEALQ